MAEDLFFNKLVTKSMEAVHGEERFFEGYLTVEIKDKQGEITVVDELYKVLPVWMDRGAPISDTHSNRIIGKGINYSKTIYKDKDGEEYPAIKITGKIHKDYELDNEIWKKIKSGEYKGLSFGGATKSDRDPVLMKDGTIAYSLKDLEHYEVAVCADPAVPLALITDYNPVAKSATNAEVREDGKMIIKCDRFGCYVTKPIPDGKGGKGDFDHCEEKNQDKNNPSAFCGAIQHKLEKAIEAGMLQQVVKNGLEIFLTREELNKVCSTCGKTLEEHGVVKYDHSNSMGDQHSMYNQNSGRESWIGQGLPQPTVEGKDDNPTEKDLTINGDAMQNSDKVKKTDLTPYESDANAKTTTQEDKVRGLPSKGKEEKKTPTFGVGGMNQFDTPKDYEKEEADSILDDAKNYGTGTPNASNMFKSLESMFKTDQADMEEEEEAVGQIVHDNESIEEKEEFDVPLPRVARAGAKPCKDCGEKHERASLLAEDRVDDALSEKDNPFRMEDASDLLSALNIDEETVEGKTGDRKHGSGEVLRSIAKREGANQAWGFKKDKLEPVLGNVQSNKSLEEMFKKKDQADEIKETGDNCPWCQKDPEGSGKPKWWRERANDWQKMLGSDSKRLGEWLSDHTFSTENRMQDTHDSDTKMHHTQAKQIPKEIEGAKEGMSGQAGANVDTMSAMGFPPSKEQSAEYKKRRDDTTKDGEAEANPDMSPNEWLQWYKKQPKKISKVTEGQLGGGQRGLGYGNEGHTIVQGSGQNHTITEMPDEVDVIVHDVNDIKESKKEGYTTEAGNNKVGDPSRATDDDDSLLSPKYIT